MYRVFESLDEMVRTVEAAYGVPMTPNCMVPRNDMLSLLDELRNALPQELDDAQDVLDKRDQILLEAEERANALVSDAEASARETLDRAHNDSEAMLHDAENRAHGLVAKAQDEADRTVESARRDAENRVDRAAAEADRLVAQGNDAYDRSVADGLAEQERLVSESEVVRRANEEAHRVVDAAHADSTRLRTECDDYVDAKLGEFEETLNSTLRVISRDRTALRRGAGALGALRQAESQRYEYEGDR